MQAWAQRWRRFVSRSARQSWGLAPQGASWSLLGLQRVTPNLVRVHTLRTLSVPPSDPCPEEEWLVPALAACAQPWWHMRPRLGMALPQTDLVRGTLAFSAPWPSEDWVAEVQLEVAQALACDPGDVNFDFEPEGLTEGLVQRVHWVGCAKTHIGRFSRWSRMAGWRLATVEPELQAACRAAVALRGGLDSLLTQAPQDWQFHLVGETATQAAGLVHPAEPTWMDSVHEAMSAPAGARLVAAGLALKTWQ